MPRQRQVQGSTLKLRHAPNVALEQAGVHQLLDTAGVVLVKPNAKCSAGNTALGKQSSPKECSEAVKNAGGRYFIYGKGSHDGDCYQELTENELCEAGWTADNDFNFYRVDAATTAIIVKPGVQCQSDHVDMGPQPSVVACKIAVQAFNGRFFTYGTGVNAQLCFKENTASAECTEGFLEGYYDFYKIEESDVVGCGFRLVGPQSKKVIPDSAITASSYYQRNPMYGLGSMWKLRMDNLGQTWTANFLNTKQWVQLDLGVPKRVTRIQTKGRSDMPQWVTNYTVSYSINGTVWTTVNQTQLYLNTTSPFFLGNNDSSTVQENELLPPIYARLIRLHPMGWHGHISMRTELIGCAREALWPGGIPPPATPKPTTTTAPETTSTIPLGPPLNLEDCKALQQAMVVDPPASCINTNYDPSGWDSCKCTIVLPPTLKPQPDNLYNPFQPTIVEDPDIPTFPPPPTVPPPNNPLQPYNAPMMVPACPFASKCSESSYDCVDFTSWGFGEAVMAKYTPAAGSLNVINCNYLKMKTGTFKIPPKISAFFNLTVKYDKVKEAQEKDLVVQCKDKNETHIWGDWCKDQVNEQMKPCLTTWNLLFDGDCMQAPPPTGFGPQSELGQLCPLQCGFLLGQTHWPAPPTPLGF